MSKPPRTRYFAGPEIWTLAQEAYLRGESARSIADRLNLTVNGVRKRAVRKGWTRTKHKAALDRQGRPQVALRAALAQAAGLIADGRHAEAAAAVRAAEALVKAARTAPADALTREERSALWAMQGEWRETERARLEEEARFAAEQMAMGMLTGRVPAASDGWSLAAFHWRARVLGREAALADFAEAVDRGWSDRFWTATGALRPLPQAAEPKMRMVLQHLGQCQGVDWSRADATAWTWPPADLQPPQPEPEPVPEPEPAPDDEGPRIWRL